MARLLHTCRPESQNHSTGGRAHALAGLGEPRAAAEHVHLQAGQVGEGTVFGVEGTVFGVEGTVLGVGSGVELL